MFDEAAVAFLRSARGAALLTRLDEEDTSDQAWLRLVPRLRADYSAHETSAARETVRLRAAAVAKFGPAAKQMLFTRDALEQASDPRVSAWRAAHFRGWDTLDVCCGIGADALALARAGASGVLALDIDPVRVALAQHNARVLSLPVQAVVADARLPLPIGYDAATFDPARRNDSGQRAHHVEDYVPPLSTVRGPGWGALRRVAVKLSPAVALEQLTPYLSTGGAVSFVSVEGALKEAVLWLGAAMPDVPAAVLLTDSTTHTWPADPTIPAAPRAAAPRAWLIEPDPALLRAGLVGQAAHAWNAAQLDPTVAYLTADVPPATPWARAWRVQAWMPFHLKRLRAALRAANIGTVTVKRRGHPLTPEALIPLLRLQGRASCTLVLTRLQGAPVVLICDDIIVDHAPG